MKKPDIRTSKSLIIIPLMFIFLLLLGLSAVINAQNRQGAWTRDMERMSDEKFSEEVWNDSLEKKYKNASKSFKAQGKGVPSRKNFYLGRETDYNASGGPEKAMSARERVGRIMDERRIELEDAMKSAQAPVSASGDIILYLKPLSRVVEVGKQFTFELSLNNYRGRPFDEIRFRINCDPSLIRFDSIEYKTYQGAFPFARVERASVYPNEGVLEYWAYSTDAHLVGSGAFCEISATALAPIGVTALDFMFGDHVKEADTAVKYRGYNILGMPGVKDDGTIRAFLTVLSPEVKRTHIVRTEIPEEAAGELRQDLGLRMVPDKLDLKAGEIKSFAIQIDNPSGMRWDQVNLVLQFDPEMIQVLDVDRGNWISSGTNIYDGDRHREFPFDFHAINLVDNKNGMIWYRNGVTSSPIESQGILATCFFKAMQPGKVKIDPYISPEMDLKGTGVMNGEALLTDSLKIGSCSISISPAAQ